MNAPAAQLNALPAEARPDVRMQLLWASARLSEVYGIVDDLGPSLPEPERAALLALRGDLARGIRCLGNVAVSVGIGGGR
ncbi:MAG: hypothetical protein Q8N53_24900 [Longimicrobiales bacterium]|nr:hypothetical protein [Longimicrobiales bacterium]